MLKGLGFRVISYKVITHPTIHSSIFLRSPVNTEANSILSRTSDAPRAEEAFPTKP